MTNLLSTPTNSPVETPPAPAVDLDDLAGSYRQSRVLLAALELGLFEFTQAPRTVAEVERHAGLHPRSAGIFLDALVGLDLLTPVRRRRVPEQRHDRALPGVVVAAVLRGRPAGAEPAVVLPLELADRGAAHR